LYAPLRDAPDLFLRFAGLARKGQISREEALAVMLKWVTTYGVLGLEDRQGRRESLVVFSQAVKDAAKCLELYEAATAPDGPDADVLERYRASGDTLSKKKEWALIVAGDIVADHVMTECYPRLYRRVEKGVGRGIGWTANETVGFAQGWGFHSLLGAMYLQMMLYITEGGGGRRCKRPGCYKFVTFEPPQPPDHPGTRKGVRGKYRTRKDKVFCSKACSQWWSDNYGNSKKANRKRKKERIS
jgi:hypothetical protein